MEVSIYKGQIKTVVDEELFESVYKPQGWAILNYELGGAERVVCEEFKVNTTNEDTIKELTATSGRKKADNKFDDKIIKG